MIVALIVLAVLATAVSALAFWLVRDDGRSRTDDLTRAGEPDSADPEEAARRAQGTHAWMRIGGGF